MQGLLHEESSIGVFILVSIVMGGAAAWASGKSLAQTWRPAWMLIPAMLVLGFGVRFIHFALFEGTLLSPYYYLVDIVILLVAGGLGYRYKRAQQMTTQYRWLYEKTGPFSWRERSGATV
ncbi:hypothetical protein SLNSH_14020 [Alsobacter soli]|uniref:DUF6867 domain-containing protein n=1 Tax=Alsobacter soli TaxID=2109933 RepID=A0A2T1HRQ4_9HYPH|nr:hypothetical protein [Alsobacter soli]PSC04344.1 hypothetical protein SLNSH_14020 [Alsobacter soli]